jgi:hypothetical protein
VLPGAVFAAPARAVKANQTPEDPFAVRGGTVGIGRRRRTPGDLLRTTSRRLIVGNIEVWFGSLVNVNPVQPMRSSVDKGRFEVGQDPELSEDDRTLRVAIEALDLAAF